MNYIYLVRYITYLVCSIIGGIILAKLIPASNYFLNACWLLEGAILVEILEWKYNAYSIEEEE